MSRFEYEPDSVHEFTTRHPQPYPRHTRGRIRWGFIGTWLLAMLFSAVFFIGLFTVITWLF